MILNWPVYLAAIVTAVFGYFVHSWDVDRIETRQVKELAAQIKSDHEKCTNAQNITQNVSQHYEDIIAKRDTDLRNYKLRHPTSCTMPVTRAPSGGNATNQPDKPGKPNGVSVADLLAFAGECETDRAKVITLQGFVLEERK